MEILNETEFDKVFALLEMSFIKDELRPYDEQKNLLKNPIYHVYVERDQNSNQLKAFIAVWDFKNFIFIDYFAVHPAFRNQRLGEKMLKSLSRLTQKDIYLEIETPKDEMTLRRLHFYERNHFILCPFFYEQPPIARGNTPVALSLMSTKNITQEKEFEEIQKVIYKYAYEPFL